MILYHADFTNFYQAIHKSITAGCSPDSNP